MKCQQVCLQLPDYATGKLPEQDMVLVAGHLNTCTDCRSELETIQTVVTGIRQLQQKQPPDIYFTNLLPRIHERIEQRSFRQIPEWALRYLFPFGAAVVMVLVLWRIVPNGEVRPLDMQSIFQQLEQDEIQQIADEQTVVGITGVVFNENGSGIAENDKDVVKELAQTNEGGTLYTVIDIQTATENLTNAEADELVAYLETNPEIN